MRASMAQTGLARGGHDPIRHGPARAYGPGQARPLPTWVGRHSPSTAGPNSTWAAPGCFYISNFSYIFSPLRYLNSKAKSTFMEKGHALALSFFGSPYKGIYFIVNGQVKRAIIVTIMSKWDCGRVFSFLSTHVSTFTDQDSYLTKLALKIIKSKRKSKRQKRQLNNPSNFGWTFFCFDASLMRIMDFMDFKYRF